MRILLTSNASYAPPRGGSTRSNLAWLRHLAEAGHHCVVVSAAAGSSDTTVQQDRIEIHSVHDLARRFTVLGDLIRKTQPDWVLVSSEDLSHVLLREAEQAAPGRVVYLAHTPQFFPFGPGSWNPDAKATDVVRRARAVVAIGSHVAGYIQRHAGVTAHVIHPPIYGSPPWPLFGRFDAGSVLMINPCRVKGIGIFAELAQRFPSVAFSALIGWGTTTADKELLATLPNVRVLSSVPDIEEVLADTRLLLMPSIWYEGFGLIAMEAMLRGLPVISSDSGGLKEAKQGTGFVLPVRPVERYLPEFDETLMPKPVEAEQDIEPWVDALNTLLTDREIYESEVRRSRERAVEFVSKLHAADFASLLARLSKMRILLAHNSLYYPSHGGGDKSNRLLMEALAALGHHLRVAARIERFGEEAQQQFLAQLRERGVSPAVNGGAVEFELHGVEVRTLTGSPNMRAFFQAQIDAFDPAVIVTSTDDPAQLLFEIAVRAPRARVVHLVRATIAVPFGPDSSMQSAARTDALHGAEAIVGVSEYVARYVRDHSGLAAVHVPISLMEPGDFRDVARFENPYVTFANPCAVKGIGLFLALADALPEVRFAAVPTWGTNAGDIAALRARPNVAILPAVDNMEDLFRQTRVLLVPSVWAEARSRIVVEGMLHGVPVIASDIGGIPEAKLGVPYLLPVNPVRSYKASVDENMVPVPEVPPQDIGPWVSALRRLIEDEAHWREIASQSRDAALAYVQSLSAGPFEALLRDVIARPKQTVAKPASDRLSEDQRRLLALRLKQRAASASKWFPVLEPGRLRLFCFPHAGAGTLLYRSWRDALKEAASVAPVCLPGRENRLSEPPFEEMGALIETLAREIRPHLDTPFAFFGHSMGAAIAFELTRALRRSGLPMPRQLIVSAARAPQFRLHHTPPPDPTDEAFLEELRRLEGVPADLLDRPEALRVLLPALKADARLYRRYVYEPGQPLDIPIAAWYGRNDPNIRPEHIEPWRGQTLAQFEVREFEGGHFYPQTHRAEFLAALLDRLSRSGSD